mmetsp:Transcript_120775/g.240549  ORF Transcript_120775/g.240549 Transcript_120775/m.240549 type:complete len:674 (+) Transcript_120775:147-2168(+)
MVHVPAARRESPLWRLHHIYGHGYRRWCKKMQCSNARLHSIARVAAEGIKDIIFEEERKKEQEVVKPVNVFQAQAVVLTDDTALVPNIYAQDVVLSDDATQTAECVVAPPPLSRVLRLHHSDVSTTAPSLAQDWLQATDDEAASCADTEVSEPGRGRKHPRRPRVGRRARARAKREEWEAARRMVYLESRAGSPGNIVGALLACIGEDSSDEERRRLSFGTTTAMLHDEGDVEAFQVQDKPYLPSELVPLDGTHADANGDDRGQVAPNRLTTNVPSPKSCETDDSSEAGHASSHAEPQAMLSGGNAERNCNDRHYNLDASSNNLAVDACARISRGPCIVMQAKSVSHTQLQVQPASISADAASVNEEVTNWEAPIIEDGTTKELGCVHNDVEVCSLGMAGHSQGPEYSHFSPGFALAAAVAADVPNKLANTSSDSDEAREVAMSVPCAADLVDSDKVSSLSDETEHTDSCSDINDDDETKLAGFADHELWLELGKGAGVLPAKLVLAVIRLQEASKHWQSRIGTDDLRSLVADGVHDLLPKFRRVKAVVSHLAETWPCPRHMNHKWAELQGWLLDGEDGPCWQQGRFKELLEDMNDSRRPFETETEWLNDEVHIRRWSLQAGWDHFLKLVDDVGCAQARKLQSEELHAEWVKNTQEVLNTRLAMSIASRSVLS